MDFTDFTQRLKKQLEQPLPGEQALARMAPPHRMELIRKILSQNKIPVQSAVLIGLYLKKNSIHTALMLRPVELGVHSGQVSFPGGRFEQQDAALEATALREAEEEVGIRRERWKVIGKLSPVYIPVSNFEVHPFVAITHTIPHFLINPDEVKQVIETPVDIFMDDAIKSKAFFPSGVGGSIEAPYFQVKGHRVWGATAMMLQELSEVLREISLR